MALNMKTRVPLKGELTDPELEKARALRRAVEDYLRVKTKTEALKVEAEMLKERIDSLGGLSEASPKLEFAGLATVTKVWKSGSEKLDRTLLVAYLMQKVGATGEQANKIADAATVKGKPSVYVEIRATARKPAPGAGKE